MSAVFSVTFMLLNVPYKNSEPKETYNMCLKYTEQAHFDTTYQHRGKKENYRNYKTA